MQWSKRSRGFDLPQHGVVDEAMTAKICPTVHHAMSDRCKPNVLEALQERSDACERILLRSEIRWLGNEKFAISVFRPERALALPDRLSLTR